MPDALIQVISPSQLGVLRRCRLAAYLAASRSRGHGPSPSNPRARLGTAAHEVLEWAAKNAPALTTSADPEPEIRAAWGRAISKQELLASQVQQEATAGPVSSWPRFAQTQEDVAVEADRLIEELSGVPADCVIAEHEFVGVSAPLRGKVDLVLLDTEQRATIVDHKTASVDDVDVQPGGRFRTQLLIYAALCRDAGYPPHRAEIRSIGRRRVAIDIDDETIDDAVSEAVDELERFNAEVLTHSPIDLASPSEDACRWCEHLVQCPAVWANSAPDLGGLRAVEGTVVSIESSKVGRVALVLDATLGTDRGRVSIAGLESRRLAILNEIAPGARVRIGGLAEVSPDTGKLVGRSGGWIRLAVLPQ
jgi:RecB family exonuclease